MFSGRILQKERIKFIFDRNQDIKKIRAVDLFVERSPSLKNPVKVEADIFTCKQALIDSKQVFLFYPVYEACLNAKKTIWHFLSTY